MTGEDGLDGKDLPQKGDTKCPSLADRFNYFTNRNETNGAAEDIWLLPCKEENDDDGSGGGVFGGGNDDNSTSSLPTELPPHAITLSMYAALPAYASDFRTFMYIVCTCLSLSLSEHSSHHSPFPSLFDSLSFAQ